MNSSAPTVDVPDFLNAPDPLSLRVSAAGEFSPETICLSRFTHGFNFCYHLSPDGARKMAAALLDMADQLDPEELPA